MNLKKFNIWVRNYFGFSKTETRALQLMLPFLLLLIISKGILQEKWTMYQNSTELDTDLLDSLYRSFQENTLTFNALNISNSPPEIEKKLLSNFDPNTADSVWLMQIGLPEKVVRNWVKFLKMDGIFRSESELKKIYGMNDSIYAVLSPYLRIKRADKTVPSPLLTQLKPLININDVDTLALKGIYGVGTKLAKRIVSFRDALGGYYTMDQLYEIYYLDSQVVDRIKEKFYVSNEFIPARLELNTSTLENLAKHPYLSLQEARMIVEYRNQHGPFSSMDDLLILPLMDDTKLEKLRPYFIINSK